VLANWKRDVLADHPLLGMWAGLDSWSYMRITEHGYETPFNPKKSETFGFFPLYPLLASIVGFCVGSAFLGALIVSSLAFIIASYLLYRLVVFEYDEPTARRSVWYLYLFPTAFILSAIYPESLLLMLSIGAFYAARLNRWWLAGLLGFLAALSKSTGVFITIALGLMYLQYIAYSWRRIRWSVFALALPALGTLALMLYEYFLTGDFFAYSHVQQIWGHHLRNPFLYILGTFKGEPTDSVINAIGVVIALLILVCGRKKIAQPYWVWTFFLVLLVPAAGVMVGSLRYMAGLFPLTIILALYGRNEQADKGIVAGARTASGSTRHLLGARVLVHGLTRLASEKLARFPHGREPIANALPEINRGGVIKVFYRHGNVPDRESLFNNRKQHLGIKDKVI
jgi:MFS family permease